MVPDTLADILHVCLDTGKSLGGASSEAPRVCDTLVHLYNFAATIL